MEAEVFFTGDRHTYVRTHGHLDSMTDLAQWADLVKIPISQIFSDFSHGITLYTLYYTSCYNCLIKAAQFGAVTRWRDTDI